MMSNLSLMFLVIIVFVGGASIANYMYANVFERRREIGTLMALGADSRLVLKVFLLKALLLGLPAESAATCWARFSPSCSARSWPAYACGRCGSWRLRRLAFRSASRWSASYFPARRAARLDPCATFQEV